MDNPNSCTGLKAKSNNKSMTSIDPWTLVSQELTPAAVANRAANANGNNSSGSSNCEYDEKLKQLESLRKKVSGDGKNSEQDWIE
jgi:hypothetical protein